MLAGVGQLIGDFTGGHHTIVNVCLGNRNEPPVTTPVTQLSACVRSTQQFRR
jgi:hypothetical protein